MSGSSREERVGILMSSFREDDSSVWPTERSA